MKFFYFAFFASFMCLMGCAQEHKYNFNFEKLDKSGRPEGWIFNINQSKSYKIGLDSLIKQDGKYSLLISQLNNGAAYDGINYTIPTSFVGKEIELKGFIRLENVTDGFAGLWLQTVGAEGPLSADYMKDQKVFGNRDWKEYSVKLHYDDTKALKINFGAVLFGNGKIWVDNLRLFIDGKPIEKSLVKQIAKEKTQADTTNYYSSKIDTILLNKSQIRNLSLLGQIWGFLKYNVPEVSTGKYNFDSELFQIIPNVLHVKNDIEFSHIIERWVDKFPKPKPCVSCFTAEDSDTYIKPDYGDIFKAKIFSKSLRNKLTYILNNRNISQNHYVDIVKNVNNPIFTNENKYENMLYPSVAYRLLALFRYWNIIQYFYPYKHLIGTKWNIELQRFIPEFIKASNKTEYVLSVLKLIGSIHDTHAQILTYSSALEDYRGNLILPFKASFIENKLVVTGFYSNDIDIRRKLQRGDVITEIDNQSIKELLGKFMPLTPGSNYEVQLRDVIKSFLLRSNQLSVDMIIIRRGLKLKLNLKTINYIKAITSEKPYQEKEEYKILKGNIGYVFAAKYKNHDLSKIKEDFKNTKGIIVDMRCYPSDFMPYSFGSYIKTGNASFVKFTSTSFKYPGRFKITSPPGAEGTNEYKGKVIVLVNEETQSQAEFTTMAFQSSKNVKVIGNTTAGADGNVSDFYLPGGLGTRISGLGILYPDGTETQRRGLKIDYFIKPTIKGIVENKDELLELAVKIINE